MYMTRNSRHRVINNNLILDPGFLKCHQTLSLNGMYKVKYAGAVSYAHPLFFLLLSHSCVSYVHEAPGSVRHQKGNICNSSAPPGQAVLTGRWFVQCTQWGYAKNLDKGGQDRQTVRGKNVPPPSLPSLHPDPTLLQLRVSLPWKKFYCIVCRSSRSDPPSTKPHPPPHIHRPSKDCCLLLSEATHEININLTSDRRVWAPK